MTDTPTPRQAATEGPEGASQPREGAGRPPGASETLRGAVEGSGGNVPVVHGCPPDGSGLTPCCWRPPFELPASDRMVITSGRITCRGPAPNGPTIREAAADDKQHWGEREWEGE